MAITWGSYKLDGTNGMRLGYEIVQYPSTVTSSTTSVDLVLNIYVGTRQSVSDSTNTFSRSGSWGSSSGSVSISHGSSSPWSSSNVTRVYNGTISVAPQYSGTVTRSFSASLTGINAVPGTVTVSGSHTVAKKPPIAPNSQSNVTVTRQSDTQHSIFWTRNATTAGPYDQQIVERWDSVGGVYRAIATISGTPSSYVDKTTVPNRRYRWRLKAKNSAGTSSSPESAASPYRYTSPAAPTSVTAKKSGTGILVSWTRNAYSEATNQVQDYPNGVAGSTFATGAGATSYTHASPDTSKTHAYRVRAAMVDPEGGTLYSAWSSLSTTVQLLAPPNAPTGLSPSAGAVDASEAVVLSWSHNPVDTSDQTAYSLRWRVQGTSTWTTIAKTASGTSARTMPADTFTNGSVIEWQVQTWGDHATASPWSTIAAFETSARPEASVLAPSGTLLGSRITAEWTYFDAEVSPQIAARVRLYSGSTTDNVLETVNVSGDSTVRALATKAQDGETYTLGVQVRDATGLWSAEATSTFLVEYASPPVPDLALQWNEDTGSVAITYGVEAPDVGEVDAVSVDIYRSANGAEWVLIGTGLPVSATIVDAIPATHGVNHYRVVAVSALPSTSESAAVGVPVPLNGWIYLNGGPGFGDVVRIGENAAPSYTPGRARALHHFAGREYPVEVTGEAKTYGVQFSARFGPDSSTWDEWDRLVDQPGPFCYRDPSVRMFVGNVQYGHSHRQMTREMTFSAERIDHNE